MTMRRLLAAAFMLTATLALADCDHNTAPTPDGRTGIGQIDYKLCHWESVFNAMVAKLLGSLGVSYPTATLLNNTSADDNIPLMFTRHATEIRAVGCHCTGTCTPTVATIALKRASDGHAISPDSTLTCSANGTAVTWQPITTDTDRNLVAGDTLLFDTTNTPNPATDTLTVEVEAAETLP